MDIQFERMTKAEPIGHWHRTTVRWRRQRVSVLSVRRILGWMAMCAAAVMVMAGPPAVAASVSWTDDEGDATGFDPFPPPLPTVLGSSPRPSDETLDLVAASAVSDGGAITFTAQTMADGIPPGSSGTTVRFLFSYDEVGYQLIAQRTAPDFATAITSGLFFRAREPSSPELNCRECTVRYDIKAATVQVKVLISSLASGIREHSAGSPKFAPGATLTDLAILSQRNIAPLARNVDVGRTVTVDAAAAGEATLTA